jgi:hypothetical protein
VGWCCPTCANFIGTAVPPLRTPHSALRNQKRPFLPPNFVRVEGGLETAVSPTRDVSRTLKQLVDQSQGSFLFQNRAQQLVDCSPVLGGLCLGSCRARNLAQGWWVNSDLLGWDANCWPAAPESLRMGSIRDVQHLCRCQLHRLRRTDLARPVVYCRRGVCLWHSG